MNKQKIKAFLKSIHTLKTQRKLKQKIIKEKIHQDDFIIKYRQNNKGREDNMFDIKLLDQSRLVFVSLIGLYQSWRKCPSHLLYSSLIIIPLKKNWVYHPLNYIHELQTHLISIFSDVTETAEFIDFIKWKDSQNLVLWSLDYDDMYSDNNKLIHPFWRCLSDKLSNLYDPLTRKKYNPINLNEKFWKNKFAQKKKKYMSILTELYFMTQKYETMKEIILQSNANSLRPVVYYKPYEETLPTERTDLFDDFDSDDNESDWWISDEYDPYDTVI